MTVLDPKTKKEFEEVLRFCAAELMKVVIVNNGEEFARDNQRLTDITLDLLRQYDFNKIIQDKLKTMLETN